MRAAELIEVEKLQVPLDDLVHWQPFILADVLNICKEFADPISLAFLQVIYQIPELLRNTCRTLILNGCIFVHPCYFLVEDEDFSDRAIVFDYEIDCVVLIFHARQGDGTDVYYLLRQILISLPLITD